SKGRGISFGHAWLLGCAEGIASQFKALEEAEKNAANAETSCALVALSERQDKAKTWLSSQVKLVQSNGISGGQDHIARLHGQAAGKNIKIKQGLNAGNSPNKLS